MRPVFMHRGLLALALSIAPVVGAQAGFEFIPPSNAQRAPSATAVPESGMGMTPAPAASVVSEALSSAAVRTAPQSILPTNNGPVVSPASMAAPAPMTPHAAPSRGPVINMNPLSGAPAQGANGMQVGQLEQAMLQQGMVGGSASVPSVSAQPVSPPPASSGRGGLGGMPLPPPVTASPSSGAYGEAVGFGKDLPLALAVSQIVPPDYTFSFDGTINPGDTVSWDGGKSWDAVLNDTLSSIEASASIDDTKKEVKIMSGRAAAAPMAPRPPVAQPAVLAMTPSPAFTPVAMTRDVAPVAAVPANEQIALSGLDKPAVLDTKAVRLWEAQRGTSLRSILTEWSMQAGVELFWSSDFDYPVESTIRIKGTFEDAIQTLLNGLRDAQPRPVGRLHPNLPEGPSVLVIETKQMIE